MLLQNLKNGWLSVVEFLTDGFPVDKYSEVNALVEHEYLNIPVQPPKVIAVINGHRIAGSSEAIDYVHGLIDTLDSMGRTIEFQNTKIIEEIEKGLKMNKEQLYDALNNAREVLLDSIKIQGIGGTRVAGYVDWYERVRDPRVNPSQDLVTYRTCKSIIELETSMLALQDSVAE